ncbi:uncharacterized protein J3R85_008410 [Psidium guajava]|nr:uncharacterized protein J3R85_008410 [Psidium guajava]
MLLLLLLLLLLADWLLLSWAHFRRLLLHFSSSTRAAPVATSPSNCCGLRPSSPQPSPSHTNPPSSPLLLPKIAPSAPPSRHHLAAVQPPPDGPATTNLQLSPLPPEPLLYRPRPSPSTAAPRNFDRSPSSQELVMLVVSPRRRRWKPLLLISGRFRVG